MPMSEATHLGDQGLLGLALRTYHFAKSLVPLLIVRHTVTVLAAPATILAVFAHGGQNKRMDQETGVARAESELLSARSSCRRSDYITVSSDLPFSRSALMS